MFRLPTVRKTPSEQQLPGIPKVEELQADHVGTATLTNLQLVIISIYPMQLVKAVPNILLTTLA